MEIVVLIAVAVVVYFMFGPKKVRQMNADADQQDLARVLRSEAEDVYGTGLQTYTFVLRKGWKGGELSTRMAHACSILKVSSLPPVYERAKNIAHAISVSWDDPGGLGSHLRRQIRD